MHSNPSPFPNLTTERLILRKLEVTDSYALLRLRSDKSVNRYLDREAAKNKADADTFIEKIQQLTPDKGFYWAISLKNRPELVGTICFWNINIEKRMAEIGYELLPDYQGKGIMLEAIAEVLHYGFDTIQLKIVAALTHPDNQSSAKLLEKTGFVRDMNYQYISEEDADGQAVYIHTA